MMKSLQGFELFFVFLFSNNPILSIDFSLYSAIIAFVVNENEKNIGDQRLLEYGVLAQEPRARIHRLTLSTIHLNGYLNNENKLF
jgi:hypothetical protein